MMSGPTTSSDVIKLPPIFKSLAGPSSEIPNGVDDAQIQTQSRRNDMPTRDSRVGALLMENLGLRPSSVSRETRLAESKPGRTTVIDSPDRFIEREALLNDEHSIFATFDLEETREKVREARRVKEERRRNFAEGLARSAQQNRMLGDANNSQRIEMLKDSKKEEEKKVKNATVGAEATQDSERVVKITARNEARSPTKPLPLKAIFTTQSDTSKPSPPHAKPLQSPKRVSAVASPHEPMLSSATISRPPSLSPPPRLPYSPIDLTSTVVSEEEEERRAKAQRRRAFGEKLQGKTHVQGQPRMPGPDMARKTGAEHVQTHDEVPYAREFVAGRSAWRWAPPSEHAHGTTSAEQAFAAELHLHAQVPAPRVSSTREAESWAAPAQAMPRQGGKASHTASQLPPTDETLDAATAEEDTAAIAFEIAAASSAAAVAAAVAGASAQRARTAAKDAAAARIAAPVLGTTVCHPPSVPPKTTRGEISSRTAEMSSPFLVKQPFLPHSAAPHSTRPRPPFANSGPVPRARQQRQRRPKANTNAPHRLPALSSELARPAELPVPAAAPPLSTRELMLCSRGGPRCRTADRKGAKARADRRARYVF